jgi:hypothetical protein
MATSPLANAYRAGEHTEWRERKWPQYDIPEANFGNLTAEAQSAQSKENLSRQERQARKVRHSLFFQTLAPFAALREIFRVLVAATVVKMNSEMVTPRRPSTPLRAGSGRRERKSEIRNLKSETCFPLDTWHSTLRTLCELGVSVVNLLEEPSL